MTLVAVVQGHEPPPSQAAASSRSAGSPAASFSICFSTWRTCFLMLRMPCRVPAAILSSGV
eukprot:CAMPEP_0182863056 /NCGR_PEP_ID=MMETSP0034_2-20130328/6425_1 /TAXON_ID=156128 /ORGANISM="Nephroselmis pyriformis, Strain CCMP717" /LENGTH=60 /DNA_ID=CAMNT_0024995213 /DNA_START=632 /DNA_END=817 /DNA_ORIENTATION=+